MNFLISVIFTLCLCQTSVPINPPNTYANYCRGTPSTNECPYLCAGIRTAQSSTMWIICINGTGYTCNPNEYPKCNNYSWFPYTTYPNPLTTQSNQTSMLMRTSDLPKFSQSPYKSYYSTRLPKIHKIINSVITIKLINSSLVKIDDEIIWPSYLSITGEILSYTNLNYIIFNPNDYKRDIVCCMHVISYNSFYGSSLGRAAVCCEKNCNCRYF